MEEKKSWCNLANKCKRIWTNAKCYLHELKRSLKIFHRIHFDTKELQAHDKADDALDDVRTLLFLPQLLQFCDKLFPYKLKPERAHKYTHRKTCIYSHKRKM